MAGTGGAASAEPDPGDDSADPVQTTGTDDSAEQADAEGAAGTRKREETVSRVPPFLRPAGTHRPSIRIVKTDSPPIIDGELEDAVWEGAALITQLAQVEPRAGDPPTEETEIRLLYDRDYLYLGLRCYDREPEAILAREMVRDVDLTTDDRVSLVVDTYHDLKNGYLFSVNPNGSRWDALIEPGEGFRDEWDGIWYAKARIDEKGWSAEIAIPYKTVSFDPNKTTWGFNIMRAIRRRNEIVRWASPSPDFGFVNLGAAGTIEGLVGIEQGIGLDVKPLFAATYRTNRETGDRDRLGNPALDAFYRVTPGLTASLTVNTDFSEAPVDERQINLGRFRLFFPETRDFFLQDAGIFEFAGLEQNGRPFFSRKIGIRESGKPVDLHAGGKLTGRIDKVGVGLLNVQQYEYGEVSSRNLSVGRLTHDLLGESFVGAIFTNGDPHSDDRNSVVGVDLRLRNSDFHGDRVITADAWLLRSFSENLSGDEEAFGARIEYPNDLINWSVFFQELGENFNPALGFLKFEDLESGVREIDTSFRYRVRPETWLRTVDSEVRFYWLGDDRDLIAAELAWDVLTFANQPGDSLTFTYTRRKEDLEPGDEIVGIPLPAKSYTFNSGEVSLSTTKARPLSVELGIGYGEFFSGHRFESQAVLEWRPSRHLLLGLEYEQNDIRLDEGDVTTRLAVLRLDLAFTPDLSWTTLAQYDNGSDTLGIQSRVRWIIEPGDEIWLILNQGYEASSDSVRSILSDVTFKVGVTFRF
jgi:hypothetical protein